MNILWGVLIIFYSLSLRSVVLALSSCPNGLNSNCICAEEGNGFSFECNGVNTNFNELLSPLEKIRIERFTVLGAYWPVCILSLSLLHIFLKLNRNSSSY